MSSYSKVLVGTDGSDSSYRAVERAAALAAATGATLVIASAYEPLSVLEQQRAVAQLGDDASALLRADPATSLLEKAAGVAQAAGATSIETAAQAGDPVDVLVGMVQAYEIDLCVVGNKGLNSIAGRLLGSVPSNISHRAGCDVLIVHTTDGSR